MINSVRATDFLPLTTYQLLVFLNVLAAREMIVRGGVQVIVLEKTDRAVHFEYTQRDIVVGSDAVLAQGPFQFIHADVLLRHVRKDHFAIMNQQAGLALHELPKAAIGARELSDEVIHQ